MVNVVAYAIMFFARPPINCRVFNLSLNDPERVADTPKRQSIWAENLDTVARDLKVVIVLAAGNCYRRTGRNDEAERTLADYPSYVLEEENRLCDPASASICITVGSLAEEGLGGRGPFGAADLRRPIAGNNEISPFSRRGPGFRGAIKPEFVEIGGNHVFQGTAGTRTVGDDGVAMFSHEPISSSLFTFGVGTSYAAPRLARTAALLEHQLRTDLRTEPQANLVKAVLAQAAKWPSELAAQAAAGKLGAEPKNIAGFGHCSAGRAALLIA